MDHPQKNDKGQTVQIKHPSSPTPLETWANPAAVATVTPGGPMPAELNGLSFDPWMDVPTTVAGWNAIEGQGATDEPPFVPTPGKHSAAGVVVEESDGRVWIVHPTNGFGGYQCTAPKGRLEPGIGFQASAIKEAYEESGLKVEITAWLLDTDRSTTRTRYYTAKRIGGNPADCSWESQAVSLVPRSLLAKFLTNSNDAPLMAALTKEDCLNRNRQRYLVVRAAQI